MISSNDAAMAASGKSGIGAILVVLGIGGMAYAMPIESNSAVVDSKSPVIYGKGTNSPLPSSVMPYLGIVAASAASFVLGIVFLAMGQRKEVHRPASMPATGTKEEEEKEKGASRSSFKDTDAA